MVAALHAADINAGCMVMVGPVKSAATLPVTLPNTLGRYRRAQDRWLGPIISPERPRFIGSWNATAMFMIALFSDPVRAAQLPLPW